MDSFEQIVKEYFAAHNIPYEATPWGGFRFRTGICTWIIQFVRGGRDGCSFVRLLHKDVFRNPPSPKRPAFIIPEYHLQFQKWLDSPAEAIEYAIRHEQKYNVVFPLDDIRPDEAESYENGRNDFRNGDVYSHREAWGLSPETEMS